MRRTTPLDVRDWLNTLSLRAHAGQLACPGFLKPYHLVTLALMLKQNHAQWLELSEEIESYALRMGLWEAANVIPPYEIPQHPTQNKFLPVAPLIDPENVLSVAQHLSKLVYQQNLHVDAFENVKTLLFELIENTFKHARVQNTLHGLVCAQAWPKGNLVQVVFADSGIGLKASLSENSALSTKLNHTSACHLATTLGVTSKPNQHSGYGLALTKDLMKQNHGTMLILSGEEGLCISAQKETLFPIPCWEGTVIILEWPINQLLDVGAVYASWPMPEGFDHHDFL